MAVSTIPSGRSCRTLRAEADFDLPKTGHNVLVIEQAI